MKGYITIPKYQKALRAKDARWMSVVNVSLDKCAALQVKRFKESLAHGKTIGMLESDLESLRRKTVNAALWEKSAYMGWLSAIVMMIISLVVIAL